MTAAEILLAKICGRRYDTEKQKKGRGPPAMWEYVQIALIFVGVVLVARIVDELIIRWRQRKREEKDREKK